VCRLFCVHAGTLDGQHAFALQAHVARLITAVPTSLLENKEHYYSVISEQVLHLIVYGLSKNDHVWFINIFMFIFSFVDNSTCCAFGCVSCCNRR
jgi:hypothetical protein